MCRSDAWGWGKHGSRTGHARVTRGSRGGAPGATRLLLLILATACAISTAVVVFAVVIIFDHSKTAVINHLVRDTELLSDGLSLFGYTRTRHTSSRAYAFILLSIVVHICIPKVDQILTENIVWC